MRTNLAVLLIATLVAFGLAEGIVRWFHKAPDIAFIEMGRYRLSRNSKIGYEPIPGFRYDGRELMYYDYRTSETNDLGFRDETHTLTKKPGTFRILALGDSITMGLFIDDRRDIYTSLMGRRLQEAGFPVEVLNFAVVGYNTQQEVETLKDKGLAYKPDLVLVGYCLNDRENSDGGLLAALLDRQRKSAQTDAARVSPALLHSHLYRFVRYRVSPQMFSSYRAYINEQYKMLQADTVDAALRDLAAVAAREHFQVALAVFPDFTNLKQYAFAAEHARLRETATALGFYFFDLQPVFLACAEDSAHYSSNLNVDNLHPNRLGHVCAGEALARLVRENVLKKSPAH